MCDPNTLSLSRISVAVCSNIWGGKRERAGMTRCPGARPAPRETQKGKEKKRKEKNWYKILCISNELRRRRVGPMPFLTPVRLARP